jgi:hypothetical protein
MGKTKVNIDQSELLNKVNKYKNVSKNISNLCKLIAKDYNDNGTTYSWSTIYNRISVYGIDTGFDMRVKKTANITAFTQLLLKSVPVEYRKYVIQLRDNPSSRRLAIKLKCLDCSNYQQGEVRGCQCFDCPLYIFRPYK